jgi:hypothetical protein
MNCVPGNIRYNNLEVALITGGFVLRDGGMNAAPAMG